jgi:hypothetical protein
VRGTIRRLLRGPRDAEGRPQPPGLGEAEWERLAAETLAHGPGVTGATGGSGTRVVARVMRRGGMFIGSDLNVSEDALDFAAFSDRWIDRYWGRGAGPDMAAELRALAARQAADRPSPAQPWGWKEPRSVYLLPFLHEQLPSLRFLHVVRDGRDMAYSSNQMQLQKHGEVLLPPADEPRPLRSIALWSDVNLAAADYGERELGERYLRLRFEDLCAEPTAGVETILRFFELAGDAPQIAADEVRSPSTFGRWRSEEPALTAALTERADTALQRFGYQSSGE